MKKFIDLSTRAKLAFGFGLLLPLLFLVAGLAYFTLTAIQKSQRELYDIHFTEVIDLMEIRADLNRNRASMLEMMVTTDRSRQQALEKDIRDRRATVDELLNELTRINQTDAEFLSRLNELKSVRTAYQQARDKQYVLIAEGKYAEALQLDSSEQNDRFEKIRGITVEMASRSQKQVSDQINADSQRTEQTIFAFIVSGVAAIVLTMVMVFILTQVIANPLNQLSSVAKQVAAGDLSVNMPFEGRLDEVGILAETFGQMVANLRRITSDIADAVNVLASSASEILVATTQVASGATETATAISETTTTVEEVRQAAQLSTQKARNVSDSSQKTAEVAQRGKRAVDDTVGGITRIQGQMESIAESIIKLSEQSQTIGEIIVSVNDLADQSNLLAVNAAIEAAKAGEHGRGFTVVAQEIKSLAEQSKQATAQVRSILSDIQKATGTAVMATEQGSKAVEAGVKQSAEAGEAIRMLADSISEAAQAAVQIVASSQQQMVGVDQVATAMENIHQASTQNVASTRQVEATAQTLHELGLKLKLMVGQFKV